MRRAGGLLIVMAICVLAQSARDAYRASYRAWREADSTLERDAATADAKLTDRAGRDAALAAKYGDERASYLKQLAVTEGETSTLLENAASPVSTPLSPSPDQYVTGEAGSVKRNMDTFGNDPDEGIQQLREELGHEYAALTALSSAMVESRKGMDAVRAAASATEQARIKALGENQDWVADLSQTAGRFAKETAGWAEYYRALAESTQVPAPNRAATQSATTQSAATQAAATQAAATQAAATENAASSGIIAPAAESAEGAHEKNRANSAAPSGPAPMPSAGSPAPELPAHFISPLLLARYVGAWAFPPRNGLYHGAQPESIELSVNERDGHARGTVSGRFTLPPGSTGDPVLRFDLFGDFTNSRSQKFDLRTSDGTKGTIELIPGPAFNLLEVNIQTDASAGRVIQVNAVLVKK